MIEGAGLVQAIRDGEGGGHHWELWIPESGVLEDTLGLKSLNVTCWPKEFNINLDFSNIMIFTFYKFL